MVLIGYLLILTGFTVLAGNVFGLFELSFTIVSATMVMVLILFKRNIMVICKTFHRDIKGIRALLRATRILKMYQRKDCTIIDLFRENVRKKPEKVCIYFQDQKWTYNDIDKLSNRIANVFHKAGYRKGDVVALLMSNCPEYVCIWLGLIKLGVIAALINYNLKSISLQHCLSVALAKAIIFDDEYESTLEEISESIEGIEKYQYLGRTSKTLKQKIMKELLDDVSDQLVADTEKIHYRDLALYIYTSGTTGLPKPAIIPHHRLSFLALGPLCIMDITEEEIVYNPLPLYHTAGGIIGVAGPLCHGYGTVIRKKFSASSYWLDCIKYGCTVAQYIGEMCRYVQMVPPRPEDTKHRVRLVFGNGMRPNIMEVFQSRFKVDRICELYGSTEGNTNIVNVDKKLGAVGFLPNIVPNCLIPLALIKVNQDGDPVRNEAGHCIRCKVNEPGMMVGLIWPNDATREYSGYVGSEIENKKKIIENVFKVGDRAFLSGDILVMDELGYLYFKDRKGDTFRWKGENVSTTELEETIASVVGMKEVTVYGVEVSNLEGRAGMATIVDPDEEVDLEMLHKELNKRLPTYARPLFLRLNKQVDMTGTFKLKKFDLQKQGFNPSVVKDKLYFNRGDGYVTLSKDLYEKIMDGKIRI